MKTAVTNRELIAVYKEDGFILDTEFTGNENPYYNEELINNFKENSYKAVFYFGFEDKDEKMSASVAFLHSLARSFIIKLSKNADIEFTREAELLSNDELFEMLETVPYVIGIEYINADWLKAFFNRLSIVFNEEITKFEGTVADFLKEHDEKLNICGRVFFHLVENKSEDYPFAFMATYSTAKAGEKRAEHVPLKNALLEYKKQQDLLLRLLSTVSHAADKSNFISELMESGELFSPLRFTAEEAYIFLKEIPVYEECGILCRIPDWWKKRSNAAKLSISIGGKAPSKVGMDALLSFNPEFFFGSDKITREEIEALLNQTEGLSYLKGKWVEVDHEKLKSILDAYEKANSLEDMTLAEAIRMQLGLHDGLGATAGKDVEIKNGEWLNNIRKKLLNPVEIGSISIGDEFKAALRHYQQIGFNWLATMKSFGFGALLADDMGLGKTVQILALLEYLRQNGDFKALLIIPASLIGNWQKEMDKFAPKLKYRVLHSKNTEFEISEADVFITTYGMAVRLEGLKVHEWDLVILDEAQAIKNPATKQTKAVKQIPSPYKIAMTGTPIENRLTDLWSIFDFLNKGLLGTSKEFGAFAKQMQNGESYAKLRSIINPFILRRLKTDKSIIDDLPDKIEMKAYASLTKKQVVLYNQLVNELEHALTNAEGIARKGVVLASIMKFKQICNHPDQYLGQSVFDDTHSGKFEKLREICETIQEKRERMLVFTQFKEMTEPIAKFLEEIFHKKGLVLHGGTQVKKRAELVEKFNGDEYVPFMVLSLKAGGVGLNLTGANHVVHFDRWWNPAIENQATDRAFRIGQRKNVIVHKFITKGTIEEKIDAMIEEKQKLAGDIITSAGETWITEMSNDELMKLISLK